MIQRRTTLEMCGASVFSETSHVNFDPAGCTSYCYLDFLQSPSCFQKKPLSSTCGQVITWASSMAKAYNLFELTEFPTGSPDAL